MNLPLLLQTVSLQIRPVWMRFFLSSALLLSLLGCSSGEKATGPVRRYHVNGKVVGVNAKNQTATIDAAAIPNYMEAMTMEYPIQSKAEFNTLHSGDHITGTLVVRADDSYSLTEIQKQNGK